MGPPPKNISNYQERWDSKEFVMYWGEKLYEIYLQDLRIVDLAAYKKTIGEITSEEEHYDKLIDKEFDTSLLKRDNLTVTPNIMFFKRDSQGFLPEILEDLYNKRKSSKKKMLECQQLAEGATGEEKQKYLNLISKHNNDQLARKVQLNSAYGALGNQYFRFYDLRIAEAVTKAGQLSIRWIESKMNKYLNTLLETKDEDFVVASDTDSIYLTLDAMVRVVFGERVGEVETEKVVDFLDNLEDRG